jgi:hypothetical protein
MPYDPKIHHRRLIRLAGYDYTLPGACFVTLNTQDHQSIDHLPLYRMHRPYLTARCFALTSDILNPDVCQLLFGQFERRIKSAMPCARVAELFLSDPWRYE